MTVANAFANTLFTHLYPHSTILITLHVLSQDGSLLAACLNASTLALIDAGVPMSDYVAACTSGSTSSYSSNDEAADPLLDLNGTEEQELPFLTVGTLGAGEKVSVLVKAIEATGSTSGKVAYDKPPTIVDCGQLDA